MFFSSSFLTQQLLFINQTHCLTDGLSALIHKFNHTCTIEYNLKTMDVNIAVSCIILCAGFFLWNVKFINHQ